MLTTVELSARPTLRTLSFSARLALQLSDGRRVPLLNDRGWSTSGPSPIWSHTSEQDIVTTARTVVGPDDPRPGHARQDAIHDHGRSLQRIARRCGGIVTTAGALAALPHEVTSGSRLLDALSDRGPIAPDRSHARPGDGASPAPPTPRGAWCFT